MSDEKFARTKVDTDRRVENGDDEEDEDGNSSDRGLEHTRIAS